MQRVNELSGNIVAPYSVFYGTVRWQEELLTEIQPLGDCCPDADWILAGFIETHFHGMREYSAEVPEDLKKIPAIAPQNGVTMICPSFSCAPESALICLLETVRDLMRGIRTGAKVAGSHLEGPFLNPAQVGGMAPSQLRLPDMDEMKRYLDAADGTLKIVTIAPELPGALDVVRFLNTKKVAVMSGHSACPPELYEEAVAAGISRFCHLFDAYDDPVTTDGIRRPALTDLCLIDDRVMKEIIMDGLHVPPELVRLSRRAAGADHILAITDAMQGAGLKEGRFLDGGEWYTIRDGGLARRERDQQIVGSALSANRAFYNMTESFRFTPVEASKTLSANHARSLGVDDRTGSLKPGLCADLTVLAADRLTVRATFVDGEPVFSAQ